jgi:hypothetical protein
MNIRDQIDSDGMALPGTPLSAVIYAIAGTAGDLQHSALDVEQAERDLAAGGDGTGDWDADEAAGFVAGLLAAAEEYVAWCQLAGRDPIEELGGSLFAPSREAQQAAVRLVRRAMEGGRG